MRNWIVLGALACALAACGGDDNGNDDRDNGDDNDDGRPQTQGECAHRVGSGTDTTDITIDTVWRKSGKDCDYLIDNSLGIHSGTLTIEPGVVVVFLQDTVIFVSDGGAIDARGTEADPIKMIGLADVDGYADGIYIGHDSRESTFDHVDFANLGKENIAYLEPGGAIGGQAGAGVNITNCSVRKSRLGGMRLDSLPLLTFANNRFNDNDGPAISVAAHQIPLLDVASDYVGADVPNGRPYIYVDGLSDGEITGNTTWKKLGVPYYVYNVVYIKGGTTTLQAGVNVVFEGDAAFRVQDGSTLVTQGTADNHVVFRGDNGAGWEGVEFYEAQGQLEYTDIVNAYIGVDAIGAFGSSTVDMTNMNFGDSAVGVCVDSESTVTGTGAIDAGGILIVDEASDPDGYDDHC